ncbi:MAG: hypothetical protein RBT69_13760, partial [Spirochaetia bacterium]|nr:hypothetical protein [Spirochaetia bacterium]
MIEYLLYILIALAAANILILLFRKNRSDISPHLRDIETSIIKFNSALDIISASMKDELQRGRQESSEISRLNREELNKSFSENIRMLNDMLAKNFSEFGSRQGEINKLTTESVRDIRHGVENQLKAIQEENTRKLDEIRQIVDEKLQK